MSSVFRYPTIFVYAENGRWYWKAVSVNKNVMATSGSYGARNAAQKAAEHFMDIASGSTIIIKESKECTWCGQKTLNGQLHARCYEAQQRIQKKRGESTGITSQTV